VPISPRLFLGIGNRILIDAFSEILGEKVMVEAVQRIRTVHSPGCGGLSDLHELNGLENSKFTKQKRNTSVLAAAGPAASITDSVKALPSVLTRWLQ
jgi:hypothetical protein